MRPSDPEIIPPGRPLPYRNADFWDGQDAGPVRRITVGRVGPFGGVLLGIGIGVAAVFGIFLVLGTAIIGLAAIGGLVVAGAIAGILRGPPRAR